MNKQFTQLIALAAGDDREIEYTSERIIVRPPDARRRPVLVYVYTPVSFVAGHAPQAVYHPSDPLSFSVKIEQLGMEAPTGPGGPLVTTECSDAAKETASFDVVDADGVSKLTLFTQFGYPVIRHQEDDDIPNVWEVTLNFKSPQPNVPSPLALTIRLFNICTKVVTLSAGIQLTLAP